ncbi:MAG TPA: hypothetical protein VNW97_20980 [Candidatus Saccharimonadales bacterium]|jgi:hypothetical protein|nr:hypothetical protein [Candidatus Saccharimonadales bacterium]
MADTRIPKLKRRPATLAQPSHRIVKPQPVKAEAYGALAAINTAFEDVISGLEALGQISYLQSETLAANLNILQRVRAQISRDAIMELHDREMANAGYFDRLCILWENETADSAR